MAGNFSFKPQRLGCAKRVEGDLFESKKFGMFDERPPLRIDPPVGNPVRIYRAGIPLVGEASGTKSNSTKIKDRRARNDNSPQRRASLQSPHGPTLLLRVPQSEQPETLDFGTDAATQVLCPHSRQSQMAAVLVLEPIFEADLQPEQYAYRKDRSALDAVRHVHKLINTGHGEIVDADLSSYFDTLPHSELMKSVARRVVDGNMLHLIKMWLEAPVEETDERGSKRRSTKNRDEGRGSPQGSPISPLLSNLYMRRFVLGWKKLGHERRLKAYIVNYADDRVPRVRKAERLSSAQLLN